MIGLLSAILLFNIMAFRLNSRLSVNQIAHIWTLTSALHLLADLYLDGKYRAYWYFEYEIDLKTIIVFPFLIPPVNILFLNWFPFGGSVLKRLAYILIWTFFCVVYEAISLLPEPWGYFHYSWWKIWYSALFYPFLLLIIVCYYKWICRIEKQ